MNTRVTSLDQLNLAFADRFNARDLDGLLALNTPDAVFVPAPGSPVTGAAAIRGALEQFLGLNLPISMTVRHTFESGHSGLAIADWTITGTGPDGSAIAIAGTTADVAVHDEEHGWCYAIEMLRRLRRPGSAATIADRVARAPSSVASCVGTVLVAPAGATSSG